ncbi:MAG: TlpA family protein disulfide reductase [Candidatus Eisenbacteria bacterium]|uniref:TlpA family protein disulfide reductase n=1 Tax=Eiseniibacteriota bacterium TaxID=2212470 RepID=A0A849T057_UNCEI|nr:TlpA family protein disulfide reductase [Candidatus Eisenbacteria bacterium]
MLRLVLTLALLATLAAPANAPESGPDSGSDLLGTPAPDWAFTRAVRDGKGSLADYRGKVVLLRWWTTGCHFCETTLPVIETLRREHARDGLVTIGVFHPKPEPHGMSDRAIVAAAEARGYHGPLVFDRDWKTLGRYWLDGHDERSWTSVSFLIDRAGTIRWVQGGGEYHPSADPEHRRCDTKYRELEQVLAEVLAEPTP